MPNDPETYIQTILEVLKAELNIKNILLIKGVDNSLIIIRCERTMVPDIVNHLNKNGVGTIHERRLSLNESLLKKLKRI
ncbi:MAG: hypothetical protein P8Y23_04290 [Candidatus Lokiarchaeota archaeon]